MEHEKPSGVAASQAAATDIGYAMRTVENLGFYPRTLPKGYKMTITPQPWIPVGERLPDEDQPVLVWMPDLPHAEHGIDIGYYMKSSWGVDWMVSGGRSAFPSHWMPLPEPPAA
jgi:hypothetical protein